ncbi:MAG TPA: hypothetical protein VK177_01230 [Flavobacteriales bacterium]|nr:hypothetical protein [Flavobacteriales bacterium]
MKNLFYALTAFVAISCNQSETKKKPQELTLSEVEEENTFDSTNYLGRNESLQKLITSPNSVRLTGIDRVKLIPIYKLRKTSNRGIQYGESSTYYEYEGITKQEDGFHYFMPGIEIIEGYNLINIAHYDVSTERLSYFFNKPTLINVAYFPGPKKDSLAFQQVTRNFFLVSAYDEDSNGDSLINKKDLRKFFYINETNSTKKQLIPKHYSAQRSTYDYKSDIMYIYTRHDRNKNGQIEKTEPVSVFWIDFKDPGTLKKLI